MDFITHYASDEIGTSLSSGVRVPNGTQLGQPCIVSLHAN
jgi:hypothetical protein